MSDATAFPSSATAAAVLASVDRTVRWHVMAVVGKTSSSSSSSQGTIPRGAAGDAVGAPAPVAGMDHCGEGCAWR